MERSGVNRGTRSTWNVNSELLTAKNDKNDLISERSNWFLVACYLIPMDLTALVPVRFSWYLLFAPYICSTWNKTAYPFPVTSRTYPRDLLPILTICRRLPLIMHRSTWGDLIRLRLRYSLTVNLHTDRTATVLTSSKRSDHPTAPR